MQIAVIVTVSLGLLFQQATAYSTGIPQKSKICTLKTDHEGTRPPPDGDFTIKIWKNGEEKKCFTTDESQTCKLVCILYNSYFANILLVLQFCSVVKIETFNC